MSLFLFITLFLLMILGVPISVSLGIAASCTLYKYTNVALSIVPSIMFSAIDSFPLMALPFFVLAGNLMSGGGISRKLIRLANIVVGGITGGLAHVAILSSMFFGAISGSSDATTAAIGTIMIPEMHKEGYNKAFTAATIAAAGTVGIIIPPSGPMVLYAILAGRVSIIKLFIGGVIPGIIMGISMMVVAYFWAKSKNGVNKNITKTSQKFKFFDLFSAFKESIFGLLMPVIILGGIYGGFFTATEAAAVASVYGIIVGCFVYRELKIKNIINIVYESAITSSVIMFLIASARVFSWLLIRERIPQVLAESMVRLTDKPIWIIAIINILLLILGTFVNTSAAVIMVTPILVPIIRSVGLDPLFMGVVIILNLAIGCITPPVGTGIFVACNIANEPIDQVILAILPYIIVLILVLILVSYIPAITMFLPNLLT